MAQSERRQSLVRTFRTKLGGPVTSTVVIIGVVMILLGAALQTGVWAGMLGILGGLMVFVSVLFRILLWMYRLI